jgi:hypothetical protein
MRLTPTGESPGGWSNLSGGFDPVGRRAVLMGGADGHDGTWALELEAFRPVHAWFMGLAATPGGLRLSWQVEGAPGAPTRLYRRVSTDWRKVAEGSVSATGELVVNDGEVESGDSLEYRLGVVSSGEEVAVGETRIVVPGVLLGLMGAVPNPSRSGLVVAFSLSTPAGARLELFDPAGRRVITREVGQLGAGIHRVDLARGRGLPPGLYFIRLRQGALSITKRAIVLE